MAEEKSVTKEIAILPSTGEIASRIIEDASKISQKIKDDLYEAAKDSRTGNVTTRHNVPNLYHNRVVKSLNHWAKMQGWQLTHTNDTFSVKPRGIKTKNLKACDRCTELKYINLVLIVVTGVSVISTVGLIFNILSNALWVIPIVFTLVIGVGLGMGIHEEMNR